MSVPNQCITKTKKTKPQKDFLIISNEDWMAASRDLTPSGFQMYLWLIRHDESFNNELSKQAFIKDFNASGSSYDRAWKELRDKKYAVQKEKGSNIYYVYTSPQTTTSTSKMTSKEENINTKNDVKPPQKDASSTSSTSKTVLNNTKNDVNQHQNWCYSTSKMNIEIDNIDNINNIDNRSVEQPTPAPSPQEPIPITQEEFIAKNLARFMVGQCITDEEGNKIVESCGKVYKVTQCSASSPVSTIQKEIADMRF